MGAIKAILRLLYLSHMGYQGYHMGAHMLLTSARGLPSPLLMPLPAQKLTPGMGTTGTTGTDLTGEATMATGPMVILTGDKKNNIRSFPADSSLNSRFFQNCFLFTQKK